MPQVATKNVLVIGSGGREHAICWKLQKSDLVKNIFVVPGSPGIAKLEKVQLVSELKLSDFKGISTWCKQKNIDLVAVGPEDPLASGIYDVLAEDNIKCFGPSKQGSQIEANKNWSKAFMIRHDIPTAKYESFTDSETAKKFILSAPYDALVVKASGLAAGKGVIVAETRQGACLAVDEIMGTKFGTAGDVVVVEELLSGEEVSVLAFVDSNTVRMMQPAQDHKRLKDNDEGLNTGGMGAYCPCPLVTKEQLEMIRVDVLQKAVDGLKKEGISYNGVLYAGMMLTPNGPKTLEFNCRFGDPETQVILPLLEDDLYEIMEACSTNTLSKFNELLFTPNLSTVGVIMASKGYPETSTKGSEISGLKKIAARENHITFHSGVSCNSNGQYFTNGGRVLINVVLAQDLKSAAALATQACEDIKFDGAQFRTDIAKKAFKSLINISYKDSGVDIAAGDSLVQRIKPLARGTDRPGVIGGLGGFGGLFRLNEAKYINKDGQEVKYQDPVLVQGTDGVGTKLKLAEETGTWDSIGIDLVAMCANDVLCNGAEPLAFLDYIACGKLNVPTASLIVKGVSLGCRESKCALVGGETAEMPSIYAPGKYDLAGYCVGVVEHKDMLPKMDKIEVGDILVGLPSSGVHSNGFSLVHKIMETNGIKLDEPAPFSKINRSYGQEFLTPTKLYASQVLPLLRKGNVKALAHITGGGLLENIPRVLPNAFKAQIDANKFEVLPVFGWLAAKGNVDDQEMLRTFNCGLGMVIVLPVGNQEWQGIAGASLVGKIVKRESSSCPQVLVENFQKVLQEVAQPFKSQTNAHSISYKQSGVDISAGDDLVKDIKPHAKATDRKGVLGGLGGFGGLFRINDLPTKYKDPVLVLGTDGVGTKLKIAQQLNNHGTVGVDLVAMCVNDILCNGADPLTFLDYFACGKLDVEVASKVVQGIADGCKQSGSALLGGETAEMPGMYAEGIYDLAGFSLGIVDHDSILPQPEKMNVGDVIIGLPSSGLHSNGFSLIHKLLELENQKLTDIAPFSANKMTFGEELLIPTKIYVKEVLAALKTGNVKAVAHITGGGLWDNIPRVLPSHLTAELEGKLINIQPIFAWLTTRNVSKIELMKTFNCGLGMVLVVAADQEKSILATLYGSGASTVGKIVPTKPNGHQLVIRNFQHCVERVERLLVAPKKRVGVLISGSGSNLQALYEATKTTAMGMCAEISFVISNKPDVFGLERCDKAGIPYRVIEHKDFPTREDFDAALSAELIQNNIDIICLAGFMRILSADFVRQWKGRLLNIHPSLLPKFKGTKAQQLALESGDRQSGCTVHFVDENVDTGDVIVQEIVPILNGDTVQTLTERILKVEHIAYPRALRLLASGYVKMGVDGKTEWV